MRIEPFHGIRYAAEVVDDLGEVTAPPYDAIDDDHQRALHAVSPYNVVRLELGLEREEDDESTNRYHRAAAQYDDWRRDGVLVPDGRGPRLHVYEQTFVAGDSSERVQVGLLAALGLSPWGEGTILPHERVFRAPVEDRKRLLRALPVNVSPVFVLYRDRSAAVQQAVDDARRRPPTSDFRSDDDVRHRHWPIEDPAAIAAIRDDLADRVGLMADGHHRYTTALEYRTEAGVPPGADQVLAYVVCEDDGPVVRATHRLVRRLPAGWRDTLERLGLVTARSWEGPRPDLALGDLHREEVAFGLVTRQRTEVLAGRAAEQLLPEGTPDVLLDLDVAALQHLLLDHLQVPDRIEDLFYTADVEDAVRAIGRGEAEALFVVRPVTLAQVRAAAAAGIRLPPKSTSFHPKPRTGLVLRPLDPGDASG